MTKEWVCEECGHEFPGKRRGIWGVKPPKCPKCKSKETRLAADFGRVGRIPD